MRTDLFDGLADDCPASGVEVVRGLTEAVSRTGLLIRVRLGEAPAVLVVVAIHDSGFTRQPGAVTNEGDQVGVGGRSLTVAVLCRYHTIFVGKRF